MIHALLICPRRSGKSVMIQKIIQELNHPVFGYITKKEQAAPNSAMGTPIYIYDPEKPRTQSEDNLLGYCKDRHYNTLPGAFNKHAARLLKPISHNHLILFDDIGFMESQEQDFCDAVLTRLDGDIPVLAAVKDKDFPFINTVRNHPNCRCFYLTKENGDEVYKEVVEFLKQSLLTARLKPYTSFHEERTADHTMQTAEKWNRRAHVWKKKPGMNQHTSQRANADLQFLMNRGVIDKNCKILDIGCGPGRFAAAFAAEANSVLGLDLSETMVEHGNEHLQEEGILNATLRACDFESLDLEKEGYQNAFDLVFSSLTPAIHDLNSLMKSMEMSRGWCCNISHIYRQNQLRVQIAKEVFGITLEPQSKGDWFHSLFNILFLSGYRPETSYETDHQENLIEPDEDYADYIMEHMLKPEERTKENADKILAWMLAHTDENGKLLEITDACYGRILWNVNKE